VLIQLKRLPGITRPSIAGHRRVTLHQEFRLLEDAILEKGTCMRHPLFSLTVAALLFIANASTTAFAQSHEVPLLKSCIREFYDPEMYDYLTFKNNCSQAMTIVFVAKDDSGRNGSMDLRPGAKDSVGRLGGRVSKVGDFELYVCVLGYVPVDDNGKVVSKPRTSFRCQPKSQ